MLSDLDSTFRFDLGEGGIPWRDRKARKGLRREKQQAWHGGMRASVHDYAATANMLSRLKFEGDE